MSNISSNIEKFNEKTNNALSFLHKNKYVTATLTLFLAVYAAYLAPKLPPYVLRLFENPLFKLLIFFLIVYTAGKNPTVAIVASVALMVSIHALNRLELDYIVRELARKDKEYMDATFSQNAPVEQPGADDAFVMEELVQRDMTLPGTTLGLLQSESKDMVLPQNDDTSCTKEAKYKQNFYPQYVNMKPDVYQARHNNGDVSGFDTSSGYAPAQ